MEYPIHWEWHIHVSLMIGTHGMWHTFFFSTLPQISNLQTYSFFFLFFCWGKIARFLLDIFNCWWLNFGPKLIDVPGKGHPFRSVGYTLGVYLIGVMHPRNKIFWNSSCYSVLFHSIECCARKRCRFATCADRTLKDTNLFLTHKKNARKL